MHLGGAEPAPRHFFTLAFTDRKNYILRRRDYTVSAVYVKFCAVSGL
jgi:hypothetical protein